MNLIVVPQAVLFEPGHWFDDHCFRLNTVLKGSQLLLASRLQTQ